MPQTRFVLKKALEFGHAVVVVVNKIDRPTARPEFVVNSTFELFIELNATDEQVNSYGYCSYNLFSVYQHTSCPNPHVHVLFQHASVISKQSMRVELKERLVYLQII